MKSVDKEVCVCVCRWTSSAKWIRQKIYCFVILEIGRLNVFGEPIINTLTQVDGKWLYCFNQSMASGMFVCFLRFVLFILPLCFSCPGVWHVCLKIDTSSERTVGLYFLLPFVFLVFPLDDHHLTGVSLIFGPYHQLFLFPNSLFFLFLFSWNVTTDILSLMFQCWWGEWKCGKSSPFYFSFIIFRLSKSGNK